MYYAKFRLGRALLDDLYGSGRPDNHKRLGGPKDMNKLGRSDKSNESIRPNHPENSSEPESIGPNDPENSNESDDPNGAGGPNDLMNQVSLKTRTGQTGPKTRTGQAGSKI